MSNVDYSEWECCEAFSLNVDFSTLWDIFELLTWFEITSQILILSMGSRIADQRRREIKP